MNQVFTYEKYSKTQRLARRVEVVVAYCGYIEVCSLKILQMHSCVIYFEGNKFLVQIFTAESQSHYVVTSVFHYRSANMW